METLTFTKKGQKKTAAGEFCGVKQAGSIVVFTVYCPNASVVQLAGDFNKWQPQQSSMRRTDKKDYWETRLSLRPGRYCYRFVIDGKWQQDPCNSNTEANPYGELNSVLLVN
ncbi:MAG: isoamylase early set domain-containing protein [Phycisphaerae bacterium]